MKSPLIVVSTGGGGGFYGGGGGGCGGIRSKGGAFVPGKGGDGVIVINWTPAGLAGLGLTSIGTLGVQMILGADGRPLARSVLLLNTIGICYRCGIQLLRQTEGWYRGVKAVWVPNGDGTLHDIIWASFDQDEPVPDWVRRVPWFTMATQVLTTASVSPWTVDDSWNATNNKVELVGAGGNGAQGTTGSNSSGGGGGSGGNYTQLTNGAVTGTVAFKVGVGGVSNVSTNRTSWESDQTGSPANYYLAESGQNASGVTGGASAAGSGFTGSPATTFTVAVTNGVVGGGTSGTNHGGGGGDAAAGPNFAGRGGGSSATGNGGGGGAGADRSTGAGVASSSTSTGGNGGPGTSGSPGTTGTTTGAAGTGNSGGRGSDGSSSVLTLTGGNGGSGTDFADGTHGLGGGGGGSGQCTSTSAAALIGGDGGLYGGGGGGTGGGRSTSSTRTEGGGGAGLIFINWGTLMGAMVM